MNTTIKTANGKEVDGLNQAPFEPIAVIGMAALMPDAESIEEFWQNIIDAHVSIKEVPKERWDPEIYWENGAPGNVTEERLTQKSVPLLKAMSLIGEDGDNLQAPCHKSIHASYGL